MLEKLVYYGWNQRSRFAPQKKTFSVTTIAEYFRSVVLSRLNEKISFVMIKEREFTGLLATSA